MGIKAYVTVPRAASATELDALASELRAAGLEFDEPEGGEQRVTGVEEALFLVVVVTTLNAFFRRIGDEAGKDAYEVLKRHVSRLRATAGDAKDGIVVLQDQCTRARADLTAQLDDAAYRGLFELDFDALEAGTLTWDGATGTWSQSR
jgi:hypothetical protein